MFTMLIILAVVLASIAFLFYLRKMAPFYSLSSKLPGPYCFPIIGSAWKFVNKNSEEMTQTIINLTKKYPSPSRFWLGPKLLIVISDPENAKIALSSKRLKQKGDLYRFMEPLLGNGLITGSGIRWKGHKKLIQPHLNSKFVERTLSVFLSFSDEFLHTLEIKVGMGSFNVAEIIQMYVGDVLALTILGYDTEARKGKNSAFLKAPKRFYELAHGRACKPWLHSDLLFKYTEWYQIQKEVIEDMDNIILKAIESAKYRTKQQGVNEDSPLLDKLLTDMNKNPEIMTEQELNYNLKTLYIASEDTIVNLSSFALLCLGMADYSKHQTIVSREIQRLPSTTNITEASTLPHLIRCIKETLRLFPVGPILFRETMDHFQLGELILPPQCAVEINIWGLHHDPNEWERPDEFYPKHFDDDYVSKRHSCSFIPFSLGSRGCVGKAMAYPFLKVILTIVLKKFATETDGDIKALKLKSDVTIRADNGYNIQLKKRN